MKRFFCLLLFLLFSLDAFSDTTTHQPLPANEAFVLSAALFGSDTILVTWTIAPKHYLYRDRFTFKVNNPKNAAIGSIILPAGEAKQDQIFGKYIVYKDKVTIPIPIINSNPTDTVLQVNYQGCSEDGYCYPPTSQQIQVNFSAATVKFNNVESVKTTTAQDTPFINLLKNQHIFTMILAFIGFGLFLSFTPCVLPMLPILSGIIVGQQKNITPRKAFGLSLTYVLSMALTYAIAGMLVGYIGGSVQTFFQQPWVLILFSLLFVLLALSLFGLYQIRMPARFEERIANISRHQKSGHYIGAALMGCLATLIVSPCVTPALVGVLGYISQTGNAWLGGIALFAMGIGMGLPLLAIGSAGGKILPKAGAWMKTVESAFGVLFLALAIWMLERILPGQITLLLWGSLLIIVSVYLGSFSPTPLRGWGKLCKGMGLLFFIYGIIIFVGAALGNNNILQPLKANNAWAPAVAHPTTLFTHVKNSEDVQQAVSIAKAQNKPVMLDFYADWCISCVEMAQTTFKDPQVQAVLAKFSTLQADITANTDVDRALLRSFNVIAPPTLVFFDTNGQPLKNLTLVGKVDPQELISHLNQVLAQSTIKQ